jgi:23S rRNA pseudouridine1911/1915/1917 synthase
MRVRETIPPAMAGERLDRVVSMISGVSRSTASDLVAEGAVEVNGTVVTARSHRVADGDVVAFPDPVSPGVVELVAEADVEVPVVFADDEVIVIDKPTGLVVHPGSGHTTGTLVHGLLHQFPEVASVGQEGRPGLVHRLDADTSGLLVVARTPSAYDHLVDQLADRSMGRAYDALVWGSFEVPRGQVDAPVGRSRRHPTRMAVTADGRPARTDFEVTEAFTQPVEVSRLRCRLHTGRTHQIRVHLKSIQRPVVGDPLYGGVRESFPVPRLWLHAAELVFVHPTSGERLVFTSPLPADLAGVLERLS